MGNLTERGLETGKVPFLQELLNQAKGTEDLSIISSTNLKTFKSNNKLSTLMIEFTQVGSREEMEIGQTFRLNT